MPKWKRHDDFASYLQEKDLEEVACASFDKGGFHSPADCHADDDGSFARHDHPRWFYLWRECGKYVFYVLSLNIDLQNE
jgi:hypothetical protein